VQVSPADRGNLKLYTEVTPINDRNCPSTPPEMSATLR
jgi:hypothetical protein